MVLLSAVGPSLLGVRRQLGPAIYFYYMLQYLLQHTKRQDCSSLQVGSRKIVPQQRVAGYKKRSIGRPSAIDAAIYKFHVLKLTLDLTPRLRTESYNYTLPLAVCSEKTFIQNVYYF